MIDLKPCPCCGHRAKLTIERIYYYDWYTIACIGCGLMIDGNDKQAIIETWQRRRTDGMIAWLDAEIKKREESIWFNVRSQASTLRDCKKQILKLLDGMGVQE